MLSLDKVFNAQTVLKNIVRETKLVRAYGIAPDCELYLKPENLQIREAFKLAKSGRPGPVLIDVPKDVQIAKYKYEPASPVEKDEPFAAKDVRIEEAATIINSAKRPFIYFGGGVITSGAQDELLSLGITIPPITIKPLSYVYARAVCAFYREI